MACWYLSEKRVEHIRNKKKPKKKNLGQTFPMRAAKRKSIFS